MTPVLDLNLVRLMRWTFRHGPCGPYFDALISEIEKAINKAVKNGK